MAPRWKIGHQDLAPVRPSSPCRRRRRGAADEAAGRLRSRCESRATPPAFEEAVAVRWGCPPTFSGSPATPGSPRSPAPTRRRRTPVHLGQRLGPSLLQAAAGGSGSAGNGSSSASGSRRPASPSSASPLGLLTVALAAGLPRPSWRGPGSSPWGRAGFTVSVRSRPGRSSAPRRRAGPRPRDSGSRPPLSAGQVEIDRRATRPAASWRPKLMRWRSEPVLTQVDAAVRASRWAPGRRRAAGPSGRSTSLGARAGRRSRPRRRAAPRPPARAAT